MMERCRTVLVACLIALSVARPVWAGSYLDRAALLLTESNRASHLLRARLGDKEFTRMVHDLMRARLEVGSHLLVPKEVTIAHPHLLMVLENHERAAEAAEHSDHQNFLLHLQKATEEERILRSIIEQHGWSFPSF